jgi:hypothetical protein
VCRLSEWYVGQKFWADGVMLVVALGLFFLAFVLRSRPRGSAICIALAGAWTTIFISGTSVFTRWSRGIF